MLGEAYNLCWFRHRATAIFGKDLYAREGFEEGRTWIAVSPIKMVNHFVELHAILS